MPLFMAINTKRFQFVMSDFEFWLIIRRALLMVIRAIEKRYGIDKK